ncbi:hypothetical protein J4434_02025 [Candidatus Woesearchaeota archaeon]|nr:hypothetical protein [Candidatus Woesearchaeota archaeon]
MRVKTPIAKLKVEDFCVSKNRRSYDEAFSSKVFAKAEGQTYYILVFENYINFTSTKIIIMTKPSKLRQCPECGSDNVKYMEKEDKLYCNDCGEIFAVLTKKQEKKFEKVSDVI